VTLITGATSGIGLALAARLAGRHRLLLTGRNLAPLDALRLGPDDRRFALDLSDPLAASEALAAALDRLGIDRLDHVVLSAGLGGYGAPETESADLVRQTLAVNLTGPVCLARMLLPRLEAAAGRLTLIGSVAHKGSPKAASYAASKAGLAGFARALREEWRGRVAVQIIHPGPVVTPMHGRAGYQPGRLARLFLSPERAAIEIEKLMASGRSPATVFAWARLRQFLSGTRS